VEDPLTLPAEGVQACSDAFWAQQYTVVLPAVCLACVPQLPKKGIKCTWMISLCTHKHTKNISICEDCFCKTCAKKTLLLKASNVCFFSLIKNFLVKEYQAPEKKYRRKNDKVSLTSRLLNRFTNCSDSSA
jgi:hypothetical protein